MYKMHTIKLINVGRMIFDVWHDDRPQRNARFWNRSDALEYAAWMNVREQELKRRQKAEAKEDLKQEVRNLLSKTEGLVDVLKRALRELK